MPCCDPLPFFLPAEDPQLHRESSHRFDVPTRPICHQTAHASRDSHFRSFCLQLAIMGHGPGLAASPPVRYNLEVGEFVTTFPVEKSVCENYPVAEFNKLTRTRRLCVSDPASECETCIEQIDSRESGFTQHGFILFRRENVQMLVDSQRSAFRLIGFQSTRHSKRRVS